MSIIIEIRLNACKKKKYVKQKSKKKKNTVYKNISSFFVLKMYLVKKNLYCIVKLVIKR